MADKHDGKAPEGSGGSGGGEKGRGGAGSGRKSGGKSGSKAMTTSGGRDAGSRSGSSGKEASRKRKRPQQAPNPAHNAVKSSHAPEVEAAVLERYDRGDGNATSKTAFKDRRVMTKVRRQEKKYGDAVHRAAQAEVLLPEETGYIEAEGMERTYKFKQEEIKAHVDINTARNAINLSLPELGPYCIDYTRNGRFLILGGRKGHLAMLDALRMDVQMEVQLKDTIRDVVALHNENMLAVAQRKYVYIYDSQGAEVHCMRKHLEPYRLHFLPYHFLLASIGRPGFLKYHDISTGTLVAEHRTGLGPCDVLSSNPHNAVLHAGHSNGVVTLWSPTMSKPLVRMFCHQGPVTSLAVDRGGQYMATAGMDGRTKVWDVRTYKEVHSYISRMPARTMSISQRGLLALGFGCHVEIWKDALATKAKAPYLVHQLTGGPSGSMDVHQLKFRPLEDFLGVGHGSGFRSLIVPGAGEANYDSYEANPFQSSKQRREAEVQSLLEKLQPETIALDPSFIGQVDKEPKVWQEEIKQLAKDADTRKVEHPKKEKNKMRGRSKIAKKLKRKQKNVVDEGVVKLRQKLATEKEKEKEGKEKSEKQKIADDAPRALARFFTDK